MTRQPPELLQMLQELVAIPSVSSVSPDWDQGNRAIVERLGDWLGDLGFRVSIQALPDRPDKANLVATLGEGHGGLVLAGHTDTVPCDANRWQSDPFTLSERDGRLYGLGICDMKGFLGLVVEAVRDLRAGDLDAPVVVVATADEESGMAGARDLLQEQLAHARHAVIGEPTGLQPVNVHKGVLMEGIRVTGHSGHSSDPALGASALEGMHRIMSDILAWRQQLQSRNVDRRFHVPVPTVNLGHIHGGDNPNRICGQCDLHIDIRPLPGMRLDDLREVLSQRLPRVLGETELSVTLEALSPGLPAMETPRDAPVVRAAEALTGADARAVAFGTEAPYLRELGLDVVVLGPGDIAQAHQPDEFLARDRLEPTVTLLRGLIRRFCSARTEASA